MKKVQILGVALLGIFACSAMMASATLGAATFLLAEWLDAGAKIAVKEAADTEGELTLISLNGGGLGVVATVLCSGIFDGTVGPESEDEVQELLALGGGGAISKTALVAPALSCTNDGNCTEPKVWAEELPWKTELELMIDEGVTSFVDLLFNGAYYVECLVLGVTINELCSNVELVFQKTNVAGGTVDEETNDSLQVLAGQKLGNCTMGGAESSEVTGLGSELLNSGDALTVSSE